MSGIEDRLSLLRARFLERARSDAEALAAALQSGDIATISRLAHGIAGNAGLFGFPDVSAEASSLEYAIEEAEPMWPDRTRALVTSLRALSA